MWIAVNLPLLPLEAVRPLWPDADASHVRPCALIAHARVALVDAAAFSLGVRRGFARSHALALAPSLECLNPDPARERHAIEAVALTLCAYTPQVVLAGAHSVLLEVSASLRLFGGLRALWRRIVATLETSGHRAVLACAPTPWAAWLFAQATVLDRRTRRVVKPRRLARVLDALPATLLPAAAAHRDGLSQIGCDTLGAVRRLPRGGVTRRFGPALLDTLARTYGEAPDPREYFEPPAVFGARLELMARVEQAEALLFAVRRLLLQLVGWLTARHAGVTRFTLTLVHETARRGDPRASTLTVAWSTPARELEHLVLMSREKLQRTELIAPVIELSLNADDVCDYEAPTETLFPLEAGPEAGREAMARLLERLVARLGADKVREIGAQADHRPEAAMTRTPYAIQRPGKTSNARRSAERRFAAQRAIEQTVAARRTSAAGASTRAATHVAAPKRASAASADAANTFVLQAASQGAQDYQGSRSRRENNPARQLLPGSEASTAAAIRRTPATPSSGKRRRLNGRLDGPHDLVPPLAPVSPRPVWLLAEPLRLTTRQGLPCYRSTMQIVSGPECIEAGWWDGQGATRDYFIVSDADAALYWVYRERMPTAEREAVWFLHGVFG